MIAKAMRAILLASATATSLKGLVCIDDAKERYKVSNQSSRLSVLFPSMRPFTTHSMHNDISHTGEESWDGLRAFSAAGFTTARDRAGATAVYGSATSSRTQCTRFL